MLHPWNIPPKNKKKEGKVLSLLVKSQRDLMLMYRHTILLTLIELAKEVSPSYMPWSTYNLCSSYPLSCTICPRWSLGVRDILKMWGQTQLLPCPKPLFFSKNAHHLELYPHTDIKNCIMNHDVSTFKATSHATMSLKKTKQVGAFCSNVDPKWYCSIDFDVMFSPKCPTYSYFCSHHLID
jgi:hypothetical protein